MTTHSKMMLSLSSASAETPAQSKKQPPYHEALRAPKAKKAFLFYKRVMFLNHLSGGLKQDLQSHRTKRAPAAHNRASPQAPGKH